MNDNEVLFHDETKYVYVGSTNPNKVQATRNIFEPLGFQVIGLKAESGVSSQPKTDAETIQGAINRAYNLPNGFFRIGLEAGVQKIDGILFLTNYGALIDEEENIYLAGGTRIPLPKEIEVLLNQGLELRDAMEKTYQVEEINLREGAIGLLTNNVVTRIDIFEHIIKLLYGQYLHHREVTNK